MIEQTTTRFSNREELEQIDEYRRFNFLAVLAVVLGIASAGMLLHLYLWLIPILAIFFGLTALARIRKNDNMGGYALAWAGIALSLFFSTWAASGIYFQRRSIYREAQDVAHQWFDLVLDGEDEIAHQSMLHPSARQAGGLSVDDYYALDEKARKDMDKVFHTPPVSEILGKKNAQVELLDNVTQDVDLTYAQLIRQVYRVTLPDREPIDLMMAITREFKDDLGRASWIVADVSLAESK